MYFGALRSASDFVPQSFFEIFIPDAEPPSFTFWVSVPIEFDIGQSPYITVRRSGCTSAYTSLVQIRIFDTLCPSDWNNDAAATIDDLLLFLTDWLAGDADFDDQPVPGTTLSDLFAYLNSWFVGCANN